MQSINTVRRTVLSLLLICSVIAILIMSNTASADEVYDIMEEAQSEAVEETALPEESDVSADEPEESKISLYVNYVAMTGVSTEEKNGEVYVPVRFFAEGMCDCRVDYTKGGLLTVKTEGLDFSAQVGQEYILANDRCLYVGEVIRQNEDGQIWLPCGVLARVFGCEYTYDVQERAVYLTASDGYILPGNEFYNEKDLYWLSHIIYAESGCEPFYGQLAVGTVVMNRVASSRFPNNVHDVVFDGRQFSPAYSGSVYRDPAQISILAAKAVLEGYRVSGNILFFHTAGAAYAGFVNNDEQMVIGHHYFYTVYGR